MPPKTRITRDMVINAAFEIARREGVESINARTVAKELNCSTQPVMYLFEKVDDLKREVYAKIDLLHTGYVMNISGDSENAMLGIGLNYIRFAAEEPNLFRYLFQSAFASEHSMIEMINSEELNPIFDVMRETLGTDMEKTKSIFLILALFSHGYASIIANNSRSYDEKIISEHLGMVFNGAISAVLGEKPQ